MSLYQLPSTDSGQRTLSIALLPLTLLSLGFTVGTERVWFLRAWRSEPVTARDVGSLSWRFLGRLVRLGLLGSAFFLLLAFGCGFAMSRLLNEEALNLAAFGFAGIVFDVALTFVLPALIYSTPSALQALRVGLSMLRTHGRHALAYVLAPPLALQALAYVSPRNDGGWIVLVAAVTALVALMCRGAIAAYYLRHAPGPVGPDGALPPPGQRYPKRSRAVAAPVPGGRPQRGFWGERLN